MLKIVVLAGGNSDEREISLRSGAAVAEALETAGYEVAVLDPAEGLGSLLQKLSEATVVFPALHGIGGEDGTVQKFLEEHDIKYVGSDSQSSALCFDKARYTERLKDRGILVPNTELVNLREFQDSALSKKPFVLKPNDGGSSIDTFIVRSLAETDDRVIQAAFARHKKLLLQELINGIEITVAILGNEALPTIEIIPPPAGEFDYENKYNGQTQELCPPKSVSPASQQTAQELSLKIHRLCGCRDMSRTDIIIAKDGRQYLLETNTIPGLTNESLLPKAAAMAGCNMPELCDRLVRLALTHDA